MADLPLTGLFRSFLGALPDAPGTDDRALLYRFVAQRDQHAFALLVRRHGPMILGLGRRLLGGPQDAEDLVQATFLVLARKAGTLRRAEAVGPWLYGVASRLARKARAAARRHARRPPAPAAPTEDFEDLTVREARQILHEELARLPDRLRAPLVLCYLEGRTRDEAARQLGCPLGTLKSRLEKGKDLLRGRLARRGVALGAALAWPAWPVAEGALAPAFVATLAGAAAVVAGGKWTVEAGITARALAWAKGGIRSMTWQKLGPLAMVLVPAVLLAGAALTAGAGTQPQPPAPAAATQAPAEEAKNRERARDLLREALTLLDGQEGNAACRPVAEIAVLQARAGDCEAARATFRKARQIVEAFPQEINRHGEIRVLVQALAHAGEATEALQLAQTLPARTEGRRKGSDYRDMVIGEAAEALAQSGFGAEGLKLVEAVDDGPRREADRGRVRFLLAITLARVGKLAEARAVADGVQDELAHVQILIGRTHKSLTWLPPPEEDGLALLRLKAGDRNEAVRLVDQAAELAGRIQDRGHKEAALAHVALGRVRLSDLPEALRLAADLGDAAWAAKVWTAVARAQAAAGLDAEARRMIDHIKPPGLHAHAQIHLALGQKEGGRRDAARITFQEAARQIDGLPEGERAIHLHNLMSARGEVGDVDAALAGVGSGDRSVALANVVHAQVKAGDLAGAWQTAEKLAPGSWWRGNVVRLIAQAEVRRDGLERVLAKQRTWQSDLDRACFLTGAAEGLLPRPPGAMD